MVDGLDAGICRVEPSAIHQLDPSEPRSTPLPRPVRFESTARDPRPRPGPGSCTPLTARWRRRPSCRSAPRRRSRGSCPEQLRATGSRMILANTYHLALRPGDEEVAAMGGLHSFMGWDGPILTDSGGFQVFSLAARAKITEAGVDVPVAPRRPAARADPRAGRCDPAEPRGRRRHVPRRLPGPARRARRRSPTPSTGPSAGPRAARRPTRGPIRPSSGSSRAGATPTSAQECAEALIALDFDGYAVGGVSVGEGRDQVRLALEVTTHRLPEDRPRYLMGVGRRRTSSTRSRPGSTCSTASCRPATAGTRPA